MVRRSYLSFLIFILHLTASAVADGDHKGDDNKHADSQGRDSYFPTYLNHVDGLDPDYYRQTCPNAEGIINNKIRGWISKDYTLAAALLRLLFHDCAVRGCDGSVLVNQPGSERSAQGSLSLRGFDVIDDIKNELEQNCPKTVSCADVLAAATRDAIYAIGGPLWQLKFGRKDGRISVAAEADSIPAGQESITDLIQFFQSKGLTILDLVALSGAHTIGQSSCGSIQYRIYNYSGSGAEDPTIDSGYLNFLTRKCQQASVYTDLDATTPTIFDGVYYQNLLKNMGLFSTDQLLYSDSRTGPLVKAFATQPFLFNQQFAVSMIKLSQTQVLTGDEGEIRIKCSAAN